MRFFNWAESFKETPTCEDILKKVRMIEIAYWIFLLLSIIIAVWGVMIIILAPADNLKALFLGLFLAIDGCLQISLIKIWAHIKLSMFRIIWDRNNKIEAEINRLEAQDL
jgi:hypothetical protein